MQFTRRETMAIGAGAALAAAMPGVVSAAVQASVEEFTGGADVATGGVTLTSPEIAENGNTVPITVDAPGAVSILVLALGNPTPPVARFEFGPLAGHQSASTRIRLAGTQEVTAIAKMADGSFAQATNTVKVTIGGCGG